MITDFSLRQLYFLTTQDPKGEDPSPNSTSWTVRYFHSPSIDYVASVILEETMLQRYLAIYTAVDAVLALERVTLVFNSKLHTCFLRQVHCNNFEQLLHRFLFNICLIVEQSKIHLKTFFVHFNKISGAFVN